MNLVRASNYEENGKVAILNEEGAALRSSPADRSSAWQLRGRSR